jgi:hypothetical protein
MANEEFIRQQIRRILLEANAESDDSESPPAPKSKAEPAPQRGQVQKGKVGRGRVSGGVKEAEALANSNPGELMRKLKISAVTGSDEEKVEKIMKQAVSTLKSTKGLEQAYSGVSLVREQDTGSVYVKISPNKLSARNALIYMKHVLVGAFNAGVLSLDNDVIPTYEDDKALIKFASS